MNCRWVKLWASSLVACLAITAPGRATEPAAVAASRGAAHVLLVNSYGPDSRWSGELAAGVREVLSSQLPRAELSVRHLPDDAGEGSEALAGFEASLRQEQAQKRFAAVIAADNAAFAFAMAAHQRLLPGVPLVFCGVSDLPPRLQERHRLVTGAVWVHDISAVVASALKRHPGTRSLVVVHDQSPSGLAYLEQMRWWADEIERRRPGLGVMFLSSTQYSTVELVEQIRMLPLDCLVLLTAWSEDRDRQPQQLDDVLARIARVSPVPVYGVSDAGSGTANALARFAEARRQGGVAARMVTKVLQGVPPSEIPIRVIRAAADVDAVEALDAAWLGEEALATSLSRRLGLPPSRSTLLVLGSLSALLLGALIALLFSTMRRHSAACRAADELRRRLDEIVDCAGLGLFEWDMDSGAMTVSNRYAEQLGYLPEQIEPTRAAWRAMVHPDDLPGVVAALEAYLDDRAPAYAISYRLLTRAGTYLRLHERGDVIRRHPDGSPSLFLGVHLAADPGSKAGSASASVLGSAALS